MSNGQPAERVASSLAVPIEPPRQAAEFAGDVANLIHAQQTDAGVSPDPADIVPEPPHLGRVLNKRAIQPSFPMPASISKGQIVKAVADLPEDATLDDAIERLLFLSKIEQGLEQARRGETIPHEEVERRIKARIASWRQ